MSRKGLSVTPNTKSQCSTPQSSHAQCGSKLMITILQSAKTTNESACTMGKVFMSPSDFKTLNVKAGSLIAIECETRELLCKVWPSRIHVAGTAVISRMWWPNFAITQKEIQRKLLFSKASGERRICLCVNGLDQKSTTSQEYAEYIHVLIIDAIFHESHRIGTTWKTRACVLHIEDIIGVECHSISAERRYLITEDTQVVIRHASDGLSNTVHTSPTVPPLPLCQLFGGYESEIKICNSMLELAGLQDLKSIFKQRVPQVINDAVDYDSRQSSYVFKRPRGLLIYGPPGCGKTHLARLLSTGSTTCLASQDQLNCLLNNNDASLRTPATAAVTPTAPRVTYTVMHITQALLLCKYEGEAEATLTDIFREARRTFPSIIIIDDIDLIFPERNSSTSSEQQKRLVSCLLTLLDGVQAHNQGEGSHDSDNDKVFVIATSSRPNNIDSALRRPGRLDKEVELSVPSAAARRLILSIMLTNHDINITEELDMSPLHTGSGSAVSVACVDKVARQAHGMVAADLLLVVKHAVFTALQRRAHDASQRQEQFLALLSPPRDNCGDVDDDECVSSSLAAELAATNLTDFHDDTSFTGLSPSPRTPAHAGRSHQEILPVIYRSGASQLAVRDSDLLFAVSRITPSALREVVVEVPCVHWTDIGGMQSVKQALKEVVEWPLLYPHLFESMNISQPKGVLLYGPPGCSKTLMAKALATESSMNFLAVRGPELLSKYLGESEKAVQSLFKKARASAPSIIFFDEIDALAGKRGDSSSGVNDRVLAQLLAEMDGSESLQRVIVVAATNRPDLLDAALLRPGRIDRKIYVGPPDDESRRQILNLELGKLTLHADVDIEAIVAATVGFSGAEVVAVCTEAAFVALDRHCLTHNHNLDTVKCERNNETNGMVVLQEDIMSVISDTKPQITDIMTQFYEEFASRH